MTTSKNVVAPNLVDIVIQLARYFGTGAKNNFLVQVYSRALQELYKGGSIDERAAWNVYHRLCDFGVIAEYGSWPNIRWQWQADQIYICSDGHLSFLAALERTTDFSGVIELLTFERCSVWRIEDRFERASSLDYLVSSEPIAISELEFQRLTGHRIKRIPRLLEALPSAKEIRFHLSRKVNQWPQESDLEALSADAGSWKPIREVETEQPLLLRRRRRHLPGYQYWLSLRRSRDLFEVSVSDWLYMLLWWESDCKWGVYYKESHKVLCVPTKIFYRLPGLIRQSLVQATFKWPVSKLLSGESYFCHSGIRKEDAKYLEAIYQPAIEIKYEY